MQSHVEPKHFLVKTEDSPDDIDGPIDSGDYAGGPDDYSGSLNRQGAAANWAEWGEWSGCGTNSSDSNQTRFRIRNCNNAPSADACNGEPTEVAPCSGNGTGNAAGNAAGNGTGDAAGNAAGNGTGAAATWAEWGEWSGCDNNSFQIINQTRFRNCNNAPADACNGEPTEVAPCSGTGDYPCRPNIDLIYPGNCTVNCCQGTVEDQARGMKSDCEGRRDVYDNIIKEYGVCNGYCSEGWNGWLEIKGYHCNITNTTNGRK